MEDEQLVRGVDRCQQLEVEPNLAEVLLTDLLFVVFGHGYLVAVPQQSERVALGGVPGVTTHSFRKTVATLIDDESLSARIGADHQGQSKVSITQDRYMSRGRVHTQVAELLDRTIKDE
jgi:integrase